MRILPEAKMYHVGVDRASLRKPPTYVRTVGSEPIDRL